MEFSAWAGRRVLHWLAPVCVLFAALAAVIALHNYRAVRNLFAADPPSPLLAAPQSTGIAGLESVSFKSNDGITLSAWYVPSSNHAAVVIADGTNSDRASMLAEIRLLARSGFGVLAFDWPGLGHNGGTIRWDSQARAALEGTLDWLSHRADVAPQRIGGLGFSIGADIMAQVAADDLRLQAVVLEAPPPDFEDYIRLHNSRWGPLSAWPAHWAIRDSGLLDPAIAPVAVIGRIAPRPVLLLAGSLDREVSPEMVRRVIESARDPKALWIVPGAQHGNYSQAAPDEYAQRLSAFFARELQSRGAVSAVKPQS